MKKLSIKPKEEQILRLFWLEENSISQSRLKETPHAKSRQKFLLMHQSRRTLEGILKPVVL